MKKYLSFLKLPLVFGIAFIPVSELNPYQSGKLNPWKGEFFLSHSYPQFPYSVSKQSNLWTKLSEMGFQSSDISGLVEAAKPFYDLSRILPSVPFRIEYTGEDIGAVEFQLDEAKVLNLTRGEEKWEAKEKVFPVSKEVVTFQGEVAESLWNSAVEAKMSPNLIVALTELFAWQVDFAREVRAGDQWRISVEKRVVRGRFAGWGDILAAEYINQGEVYQAVRFDRNGEHIGYFTPEGESLQKMFLKSPLKFGRVTSGFSKKRFHPIKKIFKPHLGVDYAAPTGTPIRAVGDGQIVLFGMRGGAGNMIRIRHNSIYQTSYLHMSRFAKGMRQGAKVKQGQVIGYVGSTGWSTGPHLHYEFYQSGRFVDPLRVKFPSAQPVPAPQLKEFKIAAEAALESLPIWMREIAAVESDVKFK